MRKELNRDLGHFRSMSSKAMLTCTKTNSGLALAFHSEKYVTDQHGRCSSVESILTEPCPNW